MTSQPTPRPDEVRHARALEQRYGARRQWSRRAGSAAAALVAALMISWPGHAFAQDAVAPDLRCLIVALELSGSSDPQVRASAEAAGMYFLGRVDGRAQTIDLPARAVEELRRMKPEDLNPEFMRCSAVLGAREAAIMEMSQRLSQQTR
jgi:hypothetical protein